MLAYIGLGSNLNNPKRQIKDALIKLNALEDIEVVDLSSLYQSKPLNNMPQPNYLNAVCKINTHLTALELLYRCQSIEDQQHRVREKKWAARTIDLDIIVYGTQVVASKKLIVPHPRMINRAFVLLPLFEIEPELQVPVLGSLKVLVEQVDQTGLKKL